MMFLKDRGGFTCDDPMFIKHKEVISIVSDSELICNLKIGYHACRHKQQIKRKFCPLSADRWWNIKSAQAMNGIL